MFDLREWRKAHQFTQAQLAEQLGMARERVNRYENQGVPEYDRRLVELACKALECPKPNPE